MVADATALTYQRDKHPFYQLTFPTMNRSFLFDASTGIVWRVLATSQVNSLGMVFTMANLRMVTGAV